VCLLEFVWILADLANETYPCSFESCYMNTSEKALKEAVESRIGRPLSTVELAAIEAAGFLDDLAATDDPERVAADFIEHLGVQKTERKPRIKVVSTERERLLALLAAEAASQDVFVVGYRARHLGGDVLPVHQLKEWLELQQAGFTHGRTWSSLQLPPGRKFERQDGHWTVAKGVPLNAAVHRQVTRTLRLTNPEEPDAEPLRVSIGGMGSLHALDVVASRLVDTFGWTARDAAAFVLTGHVPAVIRMMGIISANLRAPSLSRIWLEIDPDCTSQEVAAFFAELKGSMGLRGRGVARSDKPVRLMSLALSKGPITYEALRRLWNEKVGEEDAYGDRSAIRLALKRAKKHILEPIYNEVQSNLLADAWSRLRSD
jgi:hypothetical protein